MDEEILKIVTFIILDIVNMVIAWTIMSKNDQGMIKLKIFFTILWPIVYLLVFLVWIKVLDKIYVNVHKSDIEEIINNYSFDIYEKVNGGKCSLENLELDLLKGNFVNNKNSKIIKNYTTRLNHNVEVEFQYNKIKVKVIK